MTHYDDNLLVQRIQEGDQQAFTELVDKYKRKAFAIAFRFTNNVDDAKDLSQEAFIKVYNSINSFKRESSFYTWFYRILTNLCISFKRKRFSIITFSQFKGRNEDTESYIEECLLIDKSRSIPEDELLTKQLNRRINQAINCLSPQQKAVFILRHYEGLHLKNIAKIINCSEGAVKSQLSRSIKKLQDILGPYICED